MQNQEIIEEIRELKKRKNAVILAHCYQRIEIDLVADFVGDSLYLSRMAAGTDADLILFAGVYFMAETAKILSPDKKVLLPRLESGCYMADMINKEELLRFKNQNLGAPVVCYVNSSAEIKAESDICCTSANAVEVVKSLDASRVLFIPDRGLGSYVDSQISDKEVISYMGYCPTHMRILPEDILEKTSQHPDAEVLVHPECHMEVIKLADYVGSTSGIMKRVRESFAKTFIIATEKGVVERLERDFKNKRFILVSNKAICENMKWNTLTDILYSLRNESPEISVDKDTAEKAALSINKMLAL